MAVSPPALVADHGGGGVGAVHRDVVGGGVDRLDLLGGADLEAGGEALDLGQAGGLAPQGVAVAHQALVGGEHLGVLQAHGALAPGGDGEHREAHQALVGELQQGRVAQEANDLLVLGPGLVGGQHLALDRLPVDPQGQAGQRRPGRQGEEEHRLAVARSPGWRRPG